MDQHLNDYYSEKSLGKTPISLRQSSKLLNEGRDKWEDLENFKNQQSGGGGRLFGIQEYLLFSVVFSLMVLCLWHN